MTLADFWAQTLRRLHTELSEQQFQLAIAPITVGEERGAWVIYAKNQFSANLLRSQYAAKLAAIRAELAPHAPELIYKVGVGVRYEMADEIIASTPSAAPISDNDDEDAPEHAHSSGSIVPQPSKKNRKTKSPTHSLNLLSTQAPSPPDLTMPFTQNRADDDDGTEVSSAAIADEPALVWTDSIGGHLRYKAEDDRSNSSTMATESPKKSPIENHDSFVFTLTEMVEPKPETERKPRGRKVMTARNIVADRISNLEKDKDRKIKATSPNRPIQTETLPHRSVQAASQMTAIEAARIQAVAEQRHMQTNLSPEYSFSTLVEGKGNQLAITMGKSISERPGDTMYNPFFVYGSTGLGKTHLVQAIGNELLRLNPKARVRYMHSDEYLKTFMATVRNKTWDSFKQQYLHYNLLIIDDIQFIQGKDRTMEEFFFLFEHFHSRNQQIILTCDQLPSSLENMEKRLVSRFSWGMTLKLEPPELEMRIDILERKAAAAGVMLYEDAAFFIAQNVKQNVRELEGALNRVLARCRFEQRQIIDIDLATESLQDIIASNYKPVTIELIMKGVADFYHIRISDLLGKKRTRNVSRPRQIAMALSKDLTNMSLPAIGDAFGGRDHTTVMHAVKAVTKLRREDPEVGQDYEKLTVLVQT